MKNNSLYFASTAVLAGLLLAAAAQAQSVDYTELQQMFGEPVTTSATGKPQRASDVPADMIIITQDQIRRSGAVKLMDMLKFVPGLDVRTYGDINANINVNGYLQPAVGRLLVLINGRRQVTGSPTGSAVDLNTIPTALISRIEVITGGASGLGLEAAKRITAEGGKVCLWDMNPDTLSIAKQESGAVHTVALYVSDAKAV